MKVIELLDMIQILIEEAGKVPMTNKVMVDKDQMLSLIESLYNHMPEEFRTAQWITKEKERILKDATEQAEKIKQESYDYHRKRLKNHDVVKEAKLQAETIIKKADRSSKVIKTEAAEYAGEILHSLEVNIEKFKNEMLASVKENIGQSLGQIDSHMTEVVESLKENQEELRRMS